MNLSPLFFHVQLLSSNIVHSLIPRPNSLCIIHVLPFMVVLHPSVVLCGVYTIVMQFCLNCAVYMCIGSLWLVYWFIAVGVLVHYGWRVPMLLS